jgi:hypothetical protein
MSKVRPIGGYIDRTCDGELAPRSKNADSGDNQGSGIGTPDDGRCGGGTLGTYDPDGGGGSIYTGCLGGRAQDSVRWTVMPWGLRAAAPPEATAAVL